jgi:gliding motility-associated-like protein
MKEKLLLLFLLLITPLLAQNKNQSIGFKENKGQIIDQKGKANPAVKYLLNSYGLNVQLKKNGFSYDIYETKKHPILHLIKEKSSFSPVDYNKEKTPDYTLEYVFHRIDIDFINSNPNVELVTAEASKDYDNYYNIPSKPEGVVNVHQYQQITYKNIYPNIDVVFFVPKDTLKTVEYNFVVHPNGKISDIQMKFNGAKTELIDNKIQMNVRFGKMEETLPASWTEDGKEKKEITVGYKKIKNNIYGFETKYSISDKTVIIDPVPVRLWGTYYAGNNSEYSTDICNDKNNNVYISGYTSSTTNIATSGSFPVPYYYTNGFIAKFDSNGTRIWGVYYSTTPTTIKVDSNENLYFTGKTWGETNVSTPGSHQPLHAEYDDAYLVKLNSSGIREWGTYYGGFSADKGNDISFDNDNNVYLVGVTGSYGNIATSNTHQPNHAPGYLDDDGFIAKFTTQGVRVWGTYFGGTDGDQIFSSNISDDGFLYVTGNTRSTNGISTSNSYQPNMIGFASGMIAKFTLDGQRVWGTYFSGSTSATITKSKINNNLLYFTGITNSHDNLKSGGTFNENFIKLPLNLDFSSYISKFDVSTQSLVWGTYFGEVIQDLKVNSNNKVFVTGCTDQVTGIATAGSYSSSNQRQDAYLIKLNEIGQREWGTYYGGNGNEGNNGAADVNNKMSLDQLNNIYLVGNTNSTTGISTPGAHQENYMLNSLGGLYNIYLAKFQDCLSSPEISSNSPICIGNTIELKASGGTNYAWTGPNGFTSLEQNPTIPNATALNNGQYSCSITGTGGCDDTKIVNVIVGDVESPIPNLAALPTLTGDCNTVITTIPTASDSCAGGITATTLSPLSYNLPGTYTVVWNYNDGNGNTSTQNQTITISNQPVPTSTSPQNFCIQQNATISNIAITGQNIKWYDALTNGTLLSNTTPLQNGATYYASQTISGCESERIPVLINIQNTPAPTGNTSQTFCSSQNPTLETIVISGNEIKWYNSAGILLSNSTSLQDGVTYYASQTENNCESPNKLAITISLINTLPANNYEELFCDDLNDGSEKVNLSDYDSKLISNTSGYTFSYYSTFLGAENQLVNNRITNFSNYNLALGENKIFVRINSNTPCYAIVELKLTLVSKPIITIPDVVPICENNSITIDAGLGFDTYLWSTGATTSSIVVVNPGNYSVTVTTNYNTISCSSTKNFEVRKSNIATITSVETKDWTDNQNTITVFASGEGDYEYSIDGTHFQDSNQFLELYCGEYTVHVRDKNGCGTATDEVFLLMYPRYFTPNGDGFNDTWNIKFSDLETNLTIKIFDRYGKLIKELIQNNEWNGTMNGYDLPSDDYWFIAIRTDGNEYKGHFSLKR